jgi:hypothetical protein
MKPKQVQFLPNQIASGRVFLSCLLSTAAGESPSELAALREDSHGWPPQASEGAAGSEF